MRNGTPVVTSTVRRAGMATPILFVKVSPRARVRRPADRDYQLDNDLSEVATDVRAVLSA
jgi:hypothetical protein